MGDNDVIEINTTNLDDQIELDDIDMVDYEDSDDDLGLKKVKIETLDDNIDIDTSGFDIDIKIDNTEEGIDNTPASSTNNIKKNTDIDEGDEGDEDLDNEDDEEDDRPRVSLEKEEIEDDYAIIVCKDEFSDATPVLYEGTFDGAHKMQSVINDVIKPRRSKILSLRKPVYNEIKNDILKLNKFILSNIKDLQ